MKEFQVGNTGGVQRPIGDRTPKTKEQAGTNNLSDISVWLENPNTRSKFDTDKDGKIDAGKESDFEAFVKEQKRLEHNFKAMMKCSIGGQTTRSMKDWQKFLQNQQMDIDYDALRVARAAGGVSEYQYISGKGYAKARADEIKKHLEGEIKAVSDDIINKNMGDKLGAAGIQFLQLYQKGHGKTPDGKEETYENILKNIKRDYNADSGMTAKQLKAKYGCEGYDAALEKYFLGPITNDYQQFVETQIEQNKLAGIINLDQGIERAAHVADSTLSVYVQSPSMKNKSFSDCPQEYQNLVNREVLIAQKNNNSVNKNLFTKQKVEE